MSAPLPPEIRALLARCMSQIELEWGAPDAELRAVLGVPLDAPIGTRPPEPGEQALLPCPFCGTAVRDDEQASVNAALAAGTSADVPGWLQVTASSGMYRVECFGCGVEGKMFDAPDDAIAAWNRRHPGDALRTGEITLNEARATQGLSPLTETVLAMIDGSAGLGVGLRAYPNHLAPAQQILWKECLRLEAAGAIRRAETTSTPDCVLFVPAEDAPC